MKKLVPMKPKPIASTVILHESSETHSIELNGIHVRVDVSQQLQRVPQTVKGSYDFGDSGGDQPTFEAVTGHTDELDTAVTLLINDSRVTFRQRDWSALLALLERCTPRAY